MRCEMLNESIRLVEQKDPKIARVLSLELKRQQNNLELIASENIVSPEVMATMGMARNSIRLGSEKPLIRACCPTTRCLS